jgi:aspartate carbamoyltransferase catalytic subunit
MKHLLGIADLSASEIEDYLDRAEYYSKSLTEGKWNRALLEHKIVLILFFEDSTRTLTSFDFAAKRLGADIVNWNPEVSSLNKGETFLDTIDTLDAMNPDGVIIRHRDYGAPKILAQRMRCPVINAGDSWREHPTQALLDALTLTQHFGRLKDLTIAIIGDIAHSRVAASNMILLRKMGANVRVIAPEILMPEKLPADGVEKFYDLHEGLKGADAVMTIRPQKERMDKVLINDQAYFRDYGLTTEKLMAAAPKAVVMDPGPFIRNVQISDELADDSERFLYKKQVANGIPTRMAVLDKLIA